MPPAAIETLGWWKRDSSAKIWRDGEGGEDSCRELSDGWERVLKTATWQYAPRDRVLLCGGSAVTPASGEFPGLDGEER